MSQENVEIAQRWVELFNERGDVAEFLSLLDPEVELTRPAGPGCAVTTKRVIGSKRSSRTCDRASSRIASS
jgi:hypothetical protein